MLGTIREINGHGVFRIVAGNSTHKVVVVDESQTQLELYQRSVAPLNVVLDSFDSPEESLAYLRNHGTDLLFVDLAMTGQDGLSWLREMRNLERHLDTPVVVVTSKDYAQDRVLAKKLGAVDYLVKPLRSQEIREIICTHTGATPEENGSAAS